MSDILERLNGNGEPWTFAEVAAEIERLRAALEKINVGEGWAARIARQALEQEKPND